MTTTPPEPDIITSASSPCQRMTGEVWALDFSLWKRPIVKRFFQHARLRFAGNAATVPAGATLLVWGRRAVKGALAEGIQLIRLEDGFLRSVGLGADLVKPISWVMDSRGIYFDASTESDLEYLLSHHAFPAALLTRAEALHRAILQMGITKYNVGEICWQRPVSLRRVILVPGQVEDDASIRYGAPGISRNLDLLRTVREANPQAYVIYKPHPDVQAGLRQQGKGEQNVLAYCDDVVMDAPMNQLLEQVDEVHVMTSLTGFEALLRGRRVVCYGQPFYAGWGLTEDIQPIARRTRQLDLSQLVAATLILYPCYAHPESGQCMTPEQALDYLNSARDRPEVQPSRFLTLKRRLLARLAARRRG